MENRARAFALIFALAASPAASAVIYVPCDLPLAHVAPVLHFKAHVRRPHRRHHHRHPAGKRGRLGLHFAIAHHLCPVFVGGSLLPLPEELGGPAGAEYYGGDWVPFEIADTDLSGDEGYFGSFEGGGSAGGGDWTDFPIVLIERPPLIPPPFVTLYVPPSSSTPVPEPATWLLFAIGMAAMGFSIFRQRLATVSKWEGR
jgi:hypothetical protein